MKTTSLLVVVVFCIAVVGCGRIYGPVKQVEALIAEKDAVLEEISKKIEQSPTVAGVAEAQKILDGKKESLKAKRKAIDDAPRGTNSDWMSLLWRSDAHDSEMFKAMQQKAIATCYPCPDGVVEGIQKLEEDFKAAVK